MGEFVCFEGIDGSGKTTVAKLVVEMLNKEKSGQAYLLSKKTSRFESNYLSSIMTDLKNVLWKDGTGNPVHEVTDRGWLFLHAAWYTVLAENALSERLDTCEYVIMDGWYYKIMARFYAKHNFEKNLVDMVFSDLPKGDKVIFLDAEPEQCVIRKKTFTDAEIGANEGVRGESKNRFLRYQTRVYQAYTDIAKTRGWSFMDASSDNAEKVAERAMDLLRDRA